MANATFDSLLTLENPVLNTFTFWSAVLVLKMLLMSSLTSIHRFRKKAFSNPEDTIFNKGEVKFGDPDVERVRRAHRNDLENILPFFTIGFLYCLIDSTPWVAINLFRIIAISRIVHTLVYAVFVIPQPARAIAFFAALVPTAYMAIRVISYCF